MIIGPHVRVYEFSTVRDGSVLCAGDRVGFNCEVTRCLLGERAVLGRRIGINRTLVGADAHLSATLTVAAISLRTNPRREPSLRTSYPHTMTKAWQDDNEWHTWPPEAQWKIDVPPWATKVIIVLTSDGAVVGGFVCFEVAGGDLPLPGGVAALAQAEQDPVVADQQQVDVDDPAVPLDGEGEDISRESGEAIGYSAAAGAD